ncbi:MAG: hypothetical protein JNK46_08160, partial [Methylobacteriaceae bacterium]|nr:hypothetical protein [Methylobacteriaceae bacterium]
RRLENPLLPFAARRLPAEGARLGAFGLTTEALAALPRAPGAVEAPATVAGRPVARQAEALFVGQRPQTPEIGDLRIAYALAPEGEVSLVGRQVDGRIAAHRDADGATILLGAAGLREPADLFGAARGGNATLTWGLRLTGALAMWGAFALLLGRLTAIGELIPLVGGLLASGSRLVAFVAAALVTTLLVAGGWLIARPLPALALLAAIAAAIALWRARARRGPPPSALPRP